MILYILARQDPPRRGKCWLFSHQPYRGEDKLKNFPRWVVPRHTFLLPQRGLMRKYPWSWLCIKIEITVVLNFQNKNRGKSRFSSTFPDAFGPISSKFCNKKSGTIEDNPDSYQWMRWLMALLYFQKALCRVDRVDPRFIQSLQFIFWQEKRFVASKVG